jgi:hypothetical protein
MTDHEWRTGIRQVHDESGGVLDVTIVDSVTGAALLVAASFGDTEASAILYAVAQSATHVRQAPQRLPVLCICCPRPVKRVSTNTVFGVVAAAAPKPTGAIGFVFCEKCSNDRASLVAKATDGLRRLWPDLRSIEITHRNGGRA